MTQDEFNTMLRAALSDGLPSGYYTSQYNGEEIDKSITKTYQLTGRNLLDNWYFADPVNQRGNTEYPSAGYTIDRWRSNGGTTTIGAGGLSITAGYVLYQPFENINLADGIKRTVSYLGTDGNVYSGILTSEYALYGQYEFCYSTGAALYIKPRAGASPIAAIKLELGTQQTLARKAVDGTWTLIDPPPNKAEELAKCQRYFYRKKGTDFYPNYGNGYINSANGAFIFINVPEMRAAPTVAASGNFRLSTPGTAISVTTISPGGASTNGLQRISASAANSLTSNTPVMLQANNDASTYIDFSADL